MQSVAVVTPVASLRSQELELNASGSTLKLRGGMCLDCRHGYAPEVSSSSTPPADPAKEDPAKEKAPAPTRLSWAWVTVIVGLVLGIALVDFIVSGSVPMSVAVLAAALAGAAVVIVIGGARMLQLRRNLSDTHSRLARPNVRRDQTTSNAHRTVEADESGPSKGDRQKR